MSRNSLEKLAIFSRNADGHEERRNAERLVGPKHVHFGVASGNLLNCNLQIMKSEEGVMEVLRDDKRSSLLWQYANLSRYLVSLHLVHASVPSFRQVHYLCPISIAPGNEAMRTISEVTAFICRLRMLELFRALECKLACILLPVCHA